MHGVFESPEAALALFEQAMVSPGVLAGLRVAKEARDQFPDSAAVSSILATALRATGEAEQAKSEIDRGLALDRNDPLALAAAIKIAGFAADFDRAESLVLRAQQGPLPLDLITAIAGYYSTAGHEEPANEWTMRALKEHPMEIDAHAAAVVCSTLPKDIATHSLGWLRANHPDHTETLWLEGLTLYQASDLTGAVPFLERELEARPEAPTTLGMLSNIYMRLGDAERAEAFARRSLAFARTQSHAWRTLAAVARSKGDEGKAADYDRKADEASPLLRGFGVISQANILMKRGQWGDAANLVAPLVSAHVGALRRSALQVRARCLISVGSAADLEQAAAALEGLRASTPLIDIARARSAQIQNRVSDEIAFLEAARAGYPASGLAAAHLLYALNRGYRFEREQAVVAEVLGMAPREPSDVIHVVRALWRLRHFDEAKRMMRNGRDKFPHYSGWDGLENELVVPRSMNPLQRLIRALGRTKR